MDATQTKPLSVASLLEHIESSGLIDKDCLSRALADVEREAGAEAAGNSQVVASHLKRAGLLTGWQCERLLAGRSVVFFVGKYKLLDKLGTGGMSTVYLAEHVVMRRRVAVKILPKDRVNDSSYLARFHREARAVASLDHPNIVRAFDVDNDGDLHYLVMEYVEGQDLKALVEREGPLDYLRAADIVRQAAEGLAHAHQAGLIHRDMKPANLLIDIQGTVKVLDMGLARFTDDADASLTKEHDEKMLGTVDYLAPEQALDSHVVDPRADVYSLGCTLYFALVGSPPFPKGTLAQRVVCHQTKEPPDVIEKRPDAPAELVAICRRMMAKSRERRYQSAGDVSEALSKWAAAYVAGGGRRRASRTADVNEELSLAPLDDTVTNKGSESSKAEAPGRGPGSAKIATDERPDDSKASSSGKASASGKSSGSGKASSSGKTSPSGKASGSGKASSSGKASGSGKGSEAVRSRHATGRGPRGDSSKGFGSSKTAGTASAAGSPGPPLSALDDLLAEVAPTDGLAGAGPALGAGPIGSRRGYRSTRWDSPWFLMGVGTLLALAVIALAVVAWLLLR